MGIEDNNAIDRALDAAEATLGSQGAEEEVIAESPSTPAGGANDQLFEAEALKDNEVVRNAQGKQPQLTKSGKAPKWQPRVKDDAQISDRVASAEETGTLTGNEPPIVSTDPIPAFWPDSLKALAARTPDKALVKEFTAHHAKMEGSYKQVAQDRERYKQVVDEVYKGWDEVKGEALQHGVETPTQELQRYREWDRGFRGNRETARAFFRDLASKNGFTPQEIFGPPGQHEQQFVQQQQYRDPELHRTVTEIKSELENSKQAAKRERDAVIAQEYESFRQSPDSVGEIRADNMQRFEPQIAEVINLMRKEYPHLQRQELLHHAYECVMMDIRSKYGAPKAAPQNLQQRIDNAKRARNAAGSITGAPTTTVTAQKAKLKGKDFKSKLDSALNSAEERQGVR